MTPAEHSGLKVVAQRGGIADTLGIVTVGHTDVQIHIQCLLCSAAQGLQIAVGAGLKGHLAADEASHPQAAACAQGLVTVHIAVMVAVVGNHSAVKAPLVTQDAGQQHLAAASPNSADTVVAAHQADSVIVLDQHLEGTQIDLTQSLLGHPRVDRITVDAAFTVIADKVLDVGVDTSVIGALHGVAADDAGQQAVLGIILVVTAVEGAAVHIGGRRIPAGIAVLQSLRADGAALLLGQFAVPRLGQRAGAREAGASAHTGEAANLGGAVSVLALDLADALELGQTAVGVDVHIFHLIHGQLIEQRIPLRVIEVSAQLEAEVGGLAVVLYLQTVLCAGGDGLVGLIDVAVRHIGGVKVQCLDVVGHSAAGGVGLGEGARKVSAGHVGDVLGRVAAVQADAVNGIAAGELVGNRVAGDGVLGILDVGRQVAGNGCGGVIVHIVGIVAHGKDVIACVQLIAGKTIVVGVIGVIAGHIGDGNGQGNLLALAGLQLLRLGERAQLHAGLFNLACNIGCGVVELHNILARAVAGVGNGDLHRHIAVLRQGGAVGGGVGHLPVKAGVAQAVAEGILHNGVIAGAVLVGNTVPVALCVSGLVPFVADVNALGVIYIGNLLIGIVGIEVAADGAVRRVQTLGIGVSAHALHTGVGITGGCGQIIRPGVSGATAGFFVAPQHGGDGGCALGAGQTGNQAGIHAGDGLNLAQLHNVGGVDEHYHMGVVGTDVGQQIFFLGGQLQHRAGVVHHNVAAFFSALVLLLGGVVALACQTANHDDGRIGEVLGVVEHRLGVVGGVADVRLIQAAGLLGTAPQRFGVFTPGLEVLVHIGQLGVVLNAVSGQGGQQIGVDGVHAAGAGAAAQPGGGGPAEHVDLFGVGAQGQRVVVILHQNRALGLHIGGECLGLYFGVCNFCVRIVTAWRAEKAVNHGCQCGQEIGAYQNCDQQNHRQHQPNPMQYGMRLANLRLLCHLLLSPLTCFFLS